MYSFLSPHLIRTGLITTAASAEDLQSLAGGVTWNMLLLQTDDATGFLVHLRLDGEDAEDPTSFGTASPAVAGPVPGAVFFLIAGVAVPLVFEVPHSGAASLFASETGKSIWVSFADVKTDMHQTQKIPGMLRRGG